ncbi:hypothetical protein B0H14DRAFT_3747371 [Mycena olivaceomarginata]|nr:hypothetical protein B0H14DRAFT_3747371 [Mycena olivaceomarginata]
MSQASKESPAEYRRRGVAIGDVGTITSDGIFDFFFNIYLPAGHRINAHTPKDFAPLLRYLPEDVIDDDFDPGGYVSSSSIHEISMIFPTRGEFVFNCRGPNGAVLALPHGAHLKKLQSIAEMRHQWNDAQWWASRELANGSLYLVTGWEKAKSWGIATFHDQMQTMATDTAGTPRIAACPSMLIRHHETLWGTVRGDIEISQLADSSPFRQIGSWICTVRVSGIFVRMVFHPSQIIHERLRREAPQAAVVITHDDDWRDSFRGMTEEDGIVFLRAKSESTELKTDAISSTPDIDLADKPSPKETENCLDVSSAEELIVLSMNSIGLPPEAPGPNEKPAFQGISGQKHDGRSFQAEEESTKRESSTQLGSGNMTVTAEEESIKRGSSTLDELRAQLGSGSMTGNRLPLEAQLDTEDDIKAPPTNFMPLSPRLAAHDESLQLETHSRVGRDQPYLACGGDSDQSTAAAEDGPIFKQ